MCQYCEQYDEYIQEINYKHKTERTLRRGGGKGGEKQVRGVVGLFRKSTRKGGKGEELVGGNRFWEEDEEDVEEQEGEAAAGGGRDLMIFTLRTVLVSLITFWDA